MWANCLTLPRGPQLLPIRRADDCQFTKLLTKFAVRLENENLIANEVSVAEARNPPPTEPYLRRATFEQQFPMDWPR
jgi:hypothetical protein